MATKAALRRATKKPTVNQIKPGQGGSEPKYVPGKGPKHPVKHGGGKKPPKGGHKGGGKKPPKKHTPTAEEYAQRDPDYRRAIAGYRTNLANLKSQQTANRNDLTTDYTTTRARLMDQNALNNRNQQADFAARGLFGSGVYAKAKVDREKEETNQLNDASSSYSRNVRQINTDVANATNLEKQQESTAKAAAIRRATAQYGLTGQPAKPGKPKRAGGGKKPAQPKPHRPRQPKPTFHQIKPIRPTGPR